MCTYDRYECSPRCRIEEECLVYGGDIGRHRGGYGSGGDDCVSAEENGGRSKAFRIVEMRRGTCIYLRPNLLYTGSWCWHILLLLLLPWRSYGTASVHATMDVLLFLLRRLQDLRGTCKVSKRLQLQNLQGGHELTWNEHNKLSSTLIMAPALSNSPQ